MTIYTVEPGDSIYNISQRFAVSSEQIIGDNQLADPQSLIPGQALVLRTDSLHTPPQPWELLNNNPLLKSGPIITNGYAYPFNDIRIVNEALPSLTSLSIFSYQITAEGSLTPIEDSSMIDAALRRNSAPKMVITNLDDSGFNSDLAAAVLGSEERQSQLLQNIISVMQEKGYIGLDVDLEYLYPSDRQGYNQFLQKASRMLHQHNLLLSTAVAPKRSDEQQGMLYEAHDYAAHGRYTDYVILMTYDWGYAYGPPMAIAPLDQVKLILDYAVTVIPPQKILMGIPNYAYDWTLPYQQGVPARPLSNLDALNLARTSGAEIQYDPTAESPFFYYYDADRIQHIVWFEDARSIRAKLYQVTNYGLGGVSYWTVGKPFPQNWVVLNEMYTIGKI